MSKSDGGPAFPYIATGGPYLQPTSVPGMSLRDYFAGQAIIGVLSQKAPMSDSEVEGFVAAVWGVADAVIKGRGKVSDD